MQKKYVLHRQRKICIAEGNELYPNKISKVELLGYGKVPFSRTDKGLIVNIPNKSLKNIAPVFKIRK